MTNKYAEIAGAYNPKNVIQHRVILELVYECIDSLRNDHEAIALYAVYACEVAVFVRKHTQIDICTLTFPMEMPPLAASHPLMKALPFLEVWIEDYFRSLVADATDVAPLDHDGKARALANQIRMETACIWKAYLFALNTKPEDWGTDYVCALSALRVLSIADPGNVISNLREGGEADVIRTSVRDDDWPPRGFINLYLKNSDLLDEKMLSRVAQRTGDIEFMKQVGRQNSLRQRLRLDQGPRASAAGNVERAARLRTIDDVTSACREMGSKDFCDIVLAAVRLGNLSKDGTSIALQLREWVITGAHLRTSFPEWLAVEGRERLALLNREWLASPDRRMSFEEWYTNRK
jgi:hypothetical protein